MKRILYLNETPEALGLANSIYTIMSNVDKTQFTPVLCCPSGQLSERANKDGIEHVPYVFRMRRLKADLPFTSKRPVNPLALLWKFKEGFDLAQIIRKHRIDIIHSNSLSTHVASLVASKLTGIPLIWHIHYFMPGMLYRFALPDRIVFVSEAVRRRAFPSGAPSITQVIHNGIRLRDSVAGEIGEAIRNEFSVAAGQPLAAIIGYVDVIKGQYEVVQAWKQVVKQFPLAKLLIVGDAVSSEGQAYFQKIRQFVQDEGLGDSIIYTGYRSDVPHILKALDVYIAFTQNDANSVSVLEAMMMRKAIVGANSGGMPELITSGESGLLVDNGNIEGLADAIVTLMADPAKRIRFGEAAYQKAVSDLTFEQYMSKITAVYASLAQ